ncbi:RHS repeat-associated protein [Citrobacter sp. UYEF32]
MTTRFLWEGFRLLQEIHDDVPLTYVYSDAESYEPLARIDGTKDPDIFWFHCQPNGTPERMTDREGHIRWEGQNSAWGKLLHESIPQETGYAQNLRMQGQYLDRETGLHYNLFRYYDPDSARFTQQDPIGLAGGLNLYQYAPNPLGWIDPLGLTCIPNKVSGDAREAKLLKRLQNMFGKENVISQRHLRNADGKMVGLVDDIVQEGRKGSRILDFVVKTKDGWKGIEVTSKTAPKIVQSAKEEIIRASGGNFVRHPVTKELIELSDDISRIIRLD